MNKKLPILLAILALVAASLACNALSSEPKLSNVRTATDSDGANPTAVFSPLDTIYVVSDISNGAKGNVVSSSWYAASVEGVDPNFLIDTVEYTVEEDGFTGNVHFYFEPPDGGWPTGTYRVEVSFNGAPTSTVEFTVQ